MIKSKSNEVFTNKHFEKYADVLIWGLQTARSSTGRKYKKGDTIYIYCDLEAVRLAEVLHKKLLEKRMNVVVKIGTTPKMEYNFFKVANKKQLQFLPPWSKTLVENINGSISL